MRDIKFQFLYRGQQYGNGNTDRPWFKKVYSLDELIGRSLKELSDVHSFSELVAKRQCTSLKDKNGVEIYEGDVVKCNYMLWPDNKKFTEIKLAEMDCVNLDGDCGGGCDYEKRLLSLEVLGNIHQNPESLEK